MRCRTCDYPLWNLAGRTCPECGTSFAPSEYRFRVGAVRFRCPHCRTGYYGTSTAGHIEPGAFVCVGCDRPIALDDMLLEPAEGVAEDATGLPPNPWLARGKTGLVRAWIRSVLAILGAPAEFVRSLPAQAPLGDAVLFAAITSIAGVAVVAILGAIVAPIVLAFMPAPAGAWRQLLIQFALISMNVLWTLIGTLSAGFCAHGVLTLLRGAHGGLDRSLQVILYALGGVSAVTLVPCPCSGVIMPVWWCVAMTLMLKEVHRTSGAKAATASILSALVYFAVSVMLAAMPGVLGIGGTGVQFGPGFNTTVQTTVPAPIPIAPLLAPGVAPRLPLDLVANGSMSPDQFLQLVASGQEESFRIGQLGADDLRLGSAMAIRSEADRLARRLPEGDGPFRMGRAVFYYRAATDDPADWLVVVEPRRRSSGTFRGDYRLIRGSGDERVPVGSFRRMFDAESRRREASGRAALIPPEEIPDLDTGRLPPQPPRGRGASDADPLPTPPDESPEEEQAPHDQLRGQPDPDADQTEFEMDAEEIRER